MNAVSVIDYGVGNIGSLTNMFRHLGSEVRLVSRPEELAAADRLLLPGVGAFDHAMNELATRGLIEALKQFASSGAPLLGICLGMQLLLERSEEGQRQGLGLISGSCVRFQRDELNGLRVPQMGWNSVEPARGASIFKGLEADNRFYFVHSYRADCSNPANVLGTSQYGVPFPSMVEQENVIGMQFHPEKSHMFGMRLLSNWLAA